MESPLMIRWRGFLLVLNPKQFQQCFLNWMDSITQVLGAQVIAIDGKTLKQSYDREHKLKALHLVSAWAFFASTSAGASQS